MLEIKRIQKYIDNTKNAQKDIYSMRMNELIELINTADE